MKNKDANSKKLKSTLFKDIGFFTHGGAAAISMTFFLALFSTGDNLEKSLYLKSAALLFALSLGINSVIFILLKMFADNDTAYTILYVRKFKHVSNSGHYCFFFAVSALTAHYGKYISLAFLISAVATYYIGMKYIEECIPDETPKHPETNDKTGNI